MERKRKIARIVLCLVLVITLAVAGIAFYAQGREKAPTPLTTYWSAGSAPAQALRDYVA